MGKEDKSLLDIAIEFLEKSEGPQSINDIINYVIETKSVKKSEADDVKAQFVLDFMISGNFVYCDDNRWDLKYRQPVSVLDKDGGDYNDSYENDEEVKQNELTSENEYNYENEGIEEEQDDDDDEEEQDEDSEDLSNEFDNVVDDISELDEIDEE